MTEKTSFLASPLYEYLLQNSLREPKVLQELRHFTATLPNHQMQISPDQGQFMALLIDIIAAKWTLDIGVYTGYSALSVALALPEDGKIIACDINEERTQIAQKFWQKAGVAHKIDLRLAPAAITLQSLIDQKATNSFDFAFIDADKENYQTYYELCLQLVRPKGLILVDNTLWFGSVVDPANNSPATRAIRNFNATLYTDKRIKLSMIPVGDGLTIARKI